MRSQIDCSWSRTSGLPLRGVAACLKPEDPVCCFALWQSLQRGGGGAGRLLDGQDPCQVRRTPPDLPQEHDRGIRDVLGPARQGKAHRAKL